MISMAIIIVDDGLDDRMISDEFFRRKITPFTVLKEQVDNGELRSIATENVAAVYVVKNEMQEEVSRFALQRPRGLKTIFFDPSFLSDREKIGKMIDRICQK